MERAVRLLGKNALSKQLMEPRNLVEAIWPVAVGKAIAAHTLHIRIVRSAVVVEMEDAIWQRQLRTMSAQILDRVRALAGDAITVNEIEFRVGVPRRIPQCEGSRREGILSLAGDDEAQRIQDPVLQRIYLQSRRKAAG